jgi:hypothetical protein
MKQFASLVASLPISASTDMGSVMNYRLVLKLVCYATCTTEVHGLNMCQCLSGTLRMVSTTLISVFLFSLQNSQKYHCQRNIIVAEITGFTVYSLCPI